MVRLVFRPYTQVWASICTSERLRTSTRVSPGFILLRHSSPSFGSQHTRSITSQIYIFFFFFFSSESKKKKKKQEAGWMMMHFSLSIDFFLKLCIVLTLVNNPEILRLFHICFRCARGLSTRSTCVYVGLLGPCFKTGRIKPFRPLLRNSNLSSFLFYIF